MSDLWLEIEIDDFYEKSATFFFALTIFSQQCIYIYEPKKKCYTKIPKFRHAILAPPVSFKVGHFRPIFLAKVKAMVLNCALKKWLLIKVDIRDFLCRRHSTINRRKSTKIATKWPK